MGGDRDDDSVDSWWGKKVDGQRRGTRREGVRGCNGMQSCGSAWTSDNMQLSRRGPCFQKQGGNEKGYFEVRKKGP